MMKRERIEYAKYGRVSLLLVVSVELKVDLVRLVAPAFPFPPGVLLSDMLVIVEQRLEMTNKLIQSDTCWPIKSEM